MPSRSDDLCKVHFISGLRKVVYTRAGKRVYETTAQIAQVHFQQLALFFSLLFK
jgi:hypothetical protein